MEGGDNNGAFHFTLDASHIANRLRHRPTEAVTGAVRGRSDCRRCLEELRLRFPLHIAGIHADNGSEFRVLLQRHAESRG